MPCVQQVCVWVCPEGSTGDTTAGSSSQKQGEVALKPAMVLCSFKERLKFSRGRNCSQSDQMKVRKADGGWEENPSLYFPSSGGSSSTPSRWFGDAMLPSDIAITFSLWQQFFQKYLNGFTKICLKRSKVQKNADIWSHISTLLGNNMQRSGHFSPWLLE